MKPGEDQICIIVEIEQWIIDATKDDNRDTRRRNAMLQAISMKERDETLKLISKQKASFVRNSSVVYSIQAKTVDERSTGVLSFLAFSIKALFLPVPKLI